jgi:hypothetical protein
VGFAGRRETAEAVRPQGAQIGDWVDQAAARFPFLTRSDIVGMAAMRALLAVDTESFSSTYLAEGKHSPAQATAASAHSLLRSNIIVNGAGVLTCGALKPDLTFISDWRIQYKVPDGRETTIEVPQFRTIDDRLRCGVLMVRLREAVKETLAAGIHLHLGDGPPSVTDLVVNMTSGASGHSPFEHDYLGDISELYKEPLQVPVTARAGILAAINTSPCRSGPGTGEAFRIASLAGPRRFDAGCVAFSNAGPSDQLTIVLPADMPSTERQRSYRVALRLLMHISRETAETDPEVSASVKAHAERVANDSEKSWKAAVSSPLIVSNERARANAMNPLLQPSWGKAAEAPMVPIAAGRWYPVGVRVTTTADVNYVTRAMQGADWTVNYKRTRSRGLRQAARDKNRTFSARRCGLLMNSEGGRLPLLRYVSQADSRDHVTTTVNSNVAWFWEVHSRQAEASEPSERNSGLLLVTGWSHADGVLGYGENLLTLLGGFAEAVSVLDHDAQIQTLYLAT